MEGEFKDRFPKKLDYIIDQVYKLDTEAGISEGEEIRAELRELILSRREIANKLKEYKLTHAIQADNINLNIRAEQQIINQKIEAKLSTQNSENYLKSLLLELKNLEINENILTVELNQLKQKIKYLYNKIRIFNTLYNQPKISEKNSDLESDKTKISAAEYLPNTVLTGISKYFHWQKNIKDYNQQAEIFEEISQSWFDSADQITDITQNQFYNKYLKYYTDRENNSQVGRVFFDTEDIITKNSRIYTYFEQCNLKFWNYCNGVYIPKNDNDSHHLLFLEKDKLFRIFSSLLNINLTSEDFQNLLNLKPSLNNKNLITLHSTWFVNLSQLSDEFEDENKYVFVFPEIESLNIFVDEVCNRFGTFVDAVLADDLEQVKEILSTGIQSRILAHKLLPDANPMFPIVLNHQFNFEERNNRLKYFIGDIESKSQLCQAQIDEYSKPLLQTYFAPVRLIKDPRTGEFLMIMVEHQEHPDTQSINMQQSLPDVDQVRVYGDRFRIKNTMDVVSGLIKNYPDSKNLLTLHNKITQGIFWDDINLSAHFGRMVDAFDDAVDEFKELLRKKLANPIVAAKMTLGKIKAGNSSDPDLIEQEIMQELDEYKIFKILQEQSSIMHDIKNRMNQSDINFFNKSLALFNFFEIKSANYIYNTKLLDKTTTVGEIVEDFAGTSIYPIDNDMLGSIKSKIGNLERYVAGLYMVYSQFDNNLDKVQEYTKRYISFSFIDLGDDNLKQLDSELKIISEELQQDPKSEQLLHNWNVAAGKLLEYIKNTFGTKDQLDKEYHKLRKSIMTLGSLKEKLVNLHLY